MLETSARLLRLLSLLQSRRDWTGADLAQRLEVSPRTLRYDIGKLRALGYPVRATPGVAGGYRLGAGAALPPLLLDDEEAVAIAVSLRTAAGGTVTGIEETAVRALVKLEQLLPNRLRHRVAALHDYTVALPPAASAVPADVLVAVTAACRDQHRLRFDYRRHDGTSDVRDVEPYRLVHTGRRWYLVAFDVARQDWRTFRVDRLVLRTPPGPRFTPREAPPAGLVPRGVDTALSRLRARVTVRAPAEVIRARVPPAILVEPLDGESCVVHAGAETPHQLALHILMLDTDFVVDGPPELLDALRTVHRRSAVSSAAGAGTGPDARQRTPRGADDGLSTAGSRLAPPR